MSGRCAVLSTMESSKSSLIACCAHDRTQTTRDHETSVSAIAPGEGEPPRSRRSCRCRRSPSEPVAWISTTRSRIHTIRITPFDPVHRSRRMVPHAAPSATASERMDRPRQLSQVPHCDHSTVSPSASSRTCVRQSAVWAYTTICSSLLWSRCLRCSYAVASGSMDAVNNCGRASYLPRDVHAPGHPVSAPPTSREPYSRKETVRRSGSHRQLVRRSQMWHEDLRSAS